MTHDDAIVVPCDRYERVRVVGWGNRTSLVNAGDLNKSGRSITEKDVSAVQSVEKHWRSAAPSRLGNKHVGIT